MDVARRLTKVGGGKGTLEHFIYDMICIDLLITLSFNLGMTGSE